MCRAWTAPVVDQAEDGPNAGFPQSAQADIGPGPVGRPAGIGCDSLPQYPETKGPNAETDEQVEKLRALGEAGSIGLVKVMIADRSKGTFCTAPEFQGRDRRTRHLMPSRKWCEGKPAGSP